MDDDTKSVDSLAIPKRQKVFDKTFLPAGDKLPVWSATPLDAKLPIPPSPRGSYTFYTNKVGQSKYINDQRLDFDLTNPQGREAPGSYDSLTDPSLKTYFTSPRTKRMLVDNGLVTHRGEIICNVRDFNQYREFVRYRSVTELSLMKKREKREEQEKLDSLFSEWPSIHRKRVVKKEKLRKVYSEPPRHHSEPVVGLEMYKEDLAMGLRRTDQIRRREELRRSGKTPSDLGSPRRREASSMDLLSPRRKEAPAGSLLSPRRRDNTSLTPTSPRRRENSDLMSPRRRDDRSGNSSNESQTFMNRITLVEDMRRRELELVKRLEDRRRQREQDHRRKMEESWKERQIRQEKLLQHEAEVEAKVRDERSHHILEREKTMTHQRNRQEAKLLRIRQEMGMSRAGKSGQRVKDPRSGSTARSDDKMAKGRTDTGTGGGKTLMVNGETTGHSPDKGDEKDGEGEVAEEHYEDDYE